MSLALENPLPDQHARSTRLVHACLAVSICTQLFTSLIMHGPTDTTAGDAIFQLHRYSGFAALGFAFVFWLTLMFRHRGTAPSALFPWLHGDRRRAVFADLGKHLRSVLQGHLPAHEETSPLASAVHGLGLLLMTAMAVSGGIYAAQVWLGVQSPEPEGSLAMTVHFALGNLVWVYLIAHAGMAMIHHFAGAATLGKMWRFKG